MKDLKEIINIVSKHKIKQIEIIGNDNADSASKFQQLYNIIQTGGASTEQEAIQILYPDNPNSRDTFSKLKSRLKHRLINTLFFIDINQPQFTDIQQAFFTCNKNWMAARTLNSRGATSSSIKLAEMTIKEALKYEFTELIIYLSKMLLWHFSVIRSNNSKFSHYSQMRDFAMKDLEAENMAELYYADILREFSKSQATADERLLEKISSYSNELKTNYQSITSFRFIRISYTIHIIRHETAFNFIQAIQECHNALQIIENKPYQSKGAIFSFNLRLLSCYIQIQNFKDANALAEHYTETLSSGSYNWYIILSYQFLCNSHSKNYTNCYHILNKAITHTKFSSFYPNLKQLWLVNQAFMHFLIEAGEVDLENNRAENNFRLFKFLNEIPIYSADKRGVNISILIVHVLLLLQQRKFSNIIDRVDSLNQYCHRYLRRDDAFRANCFIKMLLQMPKASFNRMRTERYAVKYKQKLLTMPLNVAAQGIEVEIIPYEDLWEMVLPLLD